MSKEQDDNRFNKYKIYKNISVLEAAEQRIERLFNEFEEVIVGFSGGKDSTVTLNLSLMVAERLNKLPLKVMFLDQEAEWDSVIEYMREIMTDPRIEPLWFQMPIKIFNATSAEEPWLMCWEDGKEHMREREEYSIKDNHYGTDRFHDIFEKIVEKDYGDKTLCYLAGVRTEESPARMMGLTTALTYKDITWGKVLNKTLGHYTFYPIYDWTYIDVWKYIQNNNIKYCDIYDKMYAHGVAVNNMRVSNLHHETAVNNLFILQEIERETWNKLTKRISGINTAAKMGKEDFYVVDKLPYMFDDWREYRDYLLDNLITDKVIMNKMKSKFITMDSMWKHHPDQTKLFRAQINSILTNDWEFVKLQNWERSPGNADFRTSVVEGTIKNKKNNK